MTKPYKPNRLSLIVAAVAVVGGLASMPIYVAMGNPAAVWLWCDLARLC